MKRVIQSLNEMSFSLPEGWHLSKDKYDMPNGQGFFNRENYLSDDGQVISFFEIHRQPSEFFESYSALTDKYKSLTDQFEKVREFSVRLGEFVFPVYIIKGYHDKIFYMVQVFVDCGDCLGCFIIHIDNVYQSDKDTVQKNPLFAQLVKILRTIE